MGKYYKYRVLVYCPWTQRLEESDATDPYSLSTAANGERSHIVDLDAPHLRPAGWDTHPVPPLNALTDISVYELHVRDFRCDREVLGGLVRVHMHAYALTHARMHKVVYVVARAHAHAYVHTKGGWRCGWGKAHRYVHVHGLR